MAIRKPNDPLVHDGVNPSVVYGNLLNAHAIRRSLTRSEETAGPSTAKTTSTALYGTDFPSMRSNVMSITRAPSNKL